MTQTDQTTPNSDETNSEESTTPTRRRTVYLDYGPRTQTQSRKLTIDDRIDLGTGKKPEAKSRPRR
jgi:hypothetical protein